MDKQIHSLGYGAKRSHRRQRVRRRRFGYSLMGVLVIAIVALLWQTSFSGRFHHYSSSGGQLTVTQNVGAGKTTHGSGNQVGHLKNQAAGSGSQTDTERVMFVGGSIAAGEQANNKFGYLQRAFSELGHHTATHYAYTDEAIVGANSTQLATMYKGRYASWLTSVKPQVVVLSWGLLNDALPNTPMDKFDYYLRQEIHQALARGAVVLVVTPPVTKATYTKFPKQEQAYTTAEMQLVTKMHNPKVFAFNVFDQMKAYIQTHHQTYVPYAADPNHPNNAGHVLAGDLLYTDLIQQFGRQSIWHG